MQSVPSERRKSPRVALEQPVLLRMTQTGHLEFTGVSRDISKEGIFLYTESEIIEGSEVELLLTLPSEEERTSMTVRGTVVRIEKADREPLSGVAIAFRKVEIAPSEVDQHEMKI
jgi:Tfp pilus assembly protein PilZ